MKTAIYTLLAVILLASCSRAFNKVLKSTDYDYKLTKANEYYAKKDYNKAQQLYIELFPVLKGSDKFEDLYFKYAFCSYNLKDYENAENLFKGYLGVFPNNPRAEEVAFMQAMTFYKRSPKPELDQSDTHKAMGIMQSFINTYPNSTYKAEAQTIIDKCRLKLEKKLYESAKLYYNVEQYQAAGIYFTDLLNSYPESKKGDEYMLLAVKSYFQLAENSIDSKKAERYQKVVTEYFDFVDRYPNSKLLKQAEDYKITSEKNIKQINNEQTTTSSSS